MNLERICWGLRDPIRFERELYDGKEQDRGLFRRGCSAMGVTSRKIPLDTDLLRARDFLEMPGGCV